MEMNHEFIGSVMSVWRYPVKSMLGEELKSARITERGLVGDRAYALLDRETGKVASAKNPRKWPSLFKFKAALMESLDPRERVAPVMITLPDGSSVNSEQHNVDRVLSTDDLVAGQDVFVAATGVTSGALLRGVRYTHTGAITESIVMRSRSGTVRRIEARHAFEKLMKFSRIDYRP